MTLETCLPAEGSPHTRTLTAWPDRASQKNKKDLEGAKIDVAAIVNTIVNTIVNFEPVILFCNPKNIPRAKTLVSPLVRIQELEVDELWMRDTGPVYVQDGQGKLAGIDFNFNYWGAKYKGDLAPATARSILAIDGIERVQAPFVAEGGAIEVDGDGTLILIESSVVNDNRNPGATKEELEQQLKPLLGVDKVIWLKGVKDLDITDWHINAMARFVSPGRILLSRPPKGTEKAVQEAFEGAKRILAAEVDAKGKKFVVMELEEADPTLFHGDDYEMCLSYLNYLLVNNGLVIPAFREKVSDERALAMFRQLYPNRKVVQVHLNTLRRLGGGIHCATQQQPIPHAK